MQSATTSLWASHRVEASALRVYAAAKVRSQEDRPAELDEGLSDRVPLEGVGPSLQQCLVATIAWPGASFRPAGDWERRTWTIAAVGDQ